MLNKTRTLISSMGHEVSASEKYLELVRSLSDGVQVSRRETQTTTSRLADREV